MKKQPSVRQINDHIGHGVHYCYVYGSGWQARISRARTHKGIKQGRVINLSGEGAQVKEDSIGIGWVEIPADARVELAYY